MTCGRSYNHRKPVQGRPVECLVDLEDLLSLVNKYKVFYSYKICGRPSIPRRPIEGFLSLEDLVNVFDPGRPGEVFNL